MTHEFTIWPFFDEEFVFDDQQPDGWQVLDLDGSEIAVLPDITHAVAELLKWAWRWTRDGLDVAIVIRDQDGQEIRRINAVRIGPLS